MELTRVVVAVMVVVGTVGCAGAVASAPAEPPPPSLAARTVAVAAVAESMPASPPVQAPIPPPTWSAMFAAYFGPGSPGSCGRSGRCHADEMRDARSAYDWLTRRGYIDGTRSALVSPGNSCLRWFGGNMPPKATPADDATRDLQAWVAAGAPDD